MFPSIIFVSIASSSIFFLLDFAFEYRLLIYTYIRIYMEQVYSKNYLRSCVIKICTDEI